MSDASSLSDTIRFRRVRADKIPLAASGLVEAFHKLKPDDWDVLMRHVVRTSLYALFEREASMLSNSLRLYSNKAFRRGAVISLSNPIVRGFWMSELAHYSSIRDRNAGADLKQGRGVPRSPPAV